MGLRTATEITEKTAGEEIGRAFDFGELQAGETITTIDLLTVEPGGELAVSAGTITGPTVQFKLTGGVYGSVYRVHCRVLTSLAQVLEAGGLVRIGAL